MDENSKIHSDFLKVLSSCSDYITFLSEHNQNFYIVRSIWTGRKTFDLLAKELKISDSVVRYRYKRGCARLSVLLNYSYKNVIKYSSLDHEVYALRDENEALKSAFHSDISDPYVKNFNTFLFSCRELSPYSLSILENRGIKILGDFTKLTVPALKDIPHLGNTSIFSIINIMHRYNLRFHNFPSEPLSQNELSSFLSVSLDELHLYPKQRNSLRNANINTLFDLTKITIPELFSIPHLSFNSFLILVDVMNEHGLLFDTKYDIPLTDICKIN